MGIRSKSIIKYALLPGILPRIKEFVASGFSFFATMTAVIYYNVGLLNPGHPYLKPENSGRFGIRHVIAEAGRNIIYDRKHIDQIILYYTVLAGLLVLALQFFLVIGSFLLSPAFAISWYDIFVNPPAGYIPDQDIAFIVLDRAFGVQTLTGDAGGTGFFSSCYSNPAIDCYGYNDTDIVYSPAVFPTPMHTALHGMLHFYSMGISIIALLIILYNVIAIVGETVTSGTPFGKRLNKAWFVPRLMMFFALIAPVTTAGNNAGLNGAQLITLAIAKYGSNMATSTWLNFVDNGQTTISDYLGNGKELLARGNIPEVGGWSQFMHVVRTCMYAQKIINGIDVYPYIVRPHSDDTTQVTLHDGSTSDYSEMGGTEDDYLDFLHINTTFERALVFSRYQNIVLRFGHRNPPSVIPANFNINPFSNPIPPHSEEWGYVEPTCGEIIIEVNSLDPYVISGDFTEGIMPAYFWELKTYMAYDTTIDETAFCMANATLPYDHSGDCVGESYVYRDMNNQDTTSTTKWLSVRAARANIEAHSRAISEYITGVLIYTDFYGYAPALDTYQMVIDAYDTPGYEFNLLTTDLMRSRGWAGAAIWYNKIADLNGHIASAVQNIPRPFRYPIVMEEVAKQHRRYDANMSYVDRFNPRLQNGEMADLPKAGDQYIAALLYNVYDQWNAADIQDSVYTRKTGNAVIDTLNMILGTYGLFDIRKNEGAHPLAMLSTLGKNMVDAAIRNLFAGVVGQGIGELLSDSFIGDMAQVASGFAFKMSMIGLGIGFILYYVLPFLPFVYFFFAFSGWIKTIFEAVVAMPLWAMAHIKMDGEGLPGPWATNGYFLLLEILIRPTLIIVGFIGGVALYSALVEGLHQTYTQVVYVVGGYDYLSALHVPDPDLPAGKSTLSFIKGPVDELFYTIMYTIIVYMVGLSCFKMIDQIPNNIIRWMGATVSTFHETAGDPASQLSGKMYRATQTTNAQIIGLIESAKGRRSDAVIDSQILHGGLMK